MPAQYRIATDPSYLHISLTGRITPEDYFENFEELTKEEAFYPAIPTLVEIGKGAEMAVDNVIDAGEKTGNLSRIIEKARGDAQYRIAIAGGPRDTRAFVVMAQQITSVQSQARSFESPADAQRWLLS